MIVKQNKLKTNLDRDEKPQLKWNNTWNYGMTPMTSMYC